MTAEPAAGGSELKPISLQNDGFRAFVQELATKATADDEHLAEKYKDEIAKIAEIGENIVVRRNLRFHVSGTGLVASYIHTGSSIGVLLEVAFGKPDSGSAGGISERHLHAYCRFLKVH